jgi:hypothetical protein
VAELLADLMERGVSRVLKNLFFVFFAFGLVCCFAG